MVNWLHWEEDVETDDDVKINYHANKTFTVDKIKDTDTVSLQCALYLDLPLDLNSIEDYNGELECIFQNSPNDVLNFLVSNAHMDQRNVIAWMERTGMIPPPSSVPFEHTGKSFYIGDADPTTVAHANNVSIWGVWNKWGFEQNGTDRYWVNAADGGAGASVPGAGENVFFNDKASENGVWNATTHWSAATGAAASGAYACTIDVNTAALGTITQSYASATLAVVTYILEHDGAGSMSGITTFTTGTWKADGGITINAGAAFCSNTACTIDAAAFTMVGASTFNSPSAAGAMTVAGNLSGSTTMTWNQDGCTTVMDGINQTLTGFSNGAATTVLGNLTIQTSTTLTWTGTNIVGYNQSVVLTFNLAGAIADGGSGIIQIQSSNANSIVCTAMPTSFGNTPFYNYLYGDANLPAATWTTLWTVIIQARGATRTLTLTGNVTMTGGSTTNIYSAGAWATNLVVSTYTFDTSAKTGAFTCGSTNYGGAITATTGTIKIGGTLTNTGDTAFTFGSNAAYKCDLNGSLNWTVGTLNLSSGTAADSWAFSGTTWNQGAATVNGNSGLITWDKAGTSTLGSNATSFYKVTVSDGTTLDTSAASNYAYTSAYWTKIGTGTSGIMNCNGSAVSIASGVTAASGLIPYNGSTFTGGTGAHTFGSIDAYNFTAYSCTITLTTGTTTINGTTSTGCAIMTLTTGFTTWSYGAGTPTVNFTYAGTQYLYDNSNTARTMFYNMTVTKTGANVLQFYNGKGFNLTVAAALTITSGTFSTVEAVSGTSRNLTVTAATSIANGGSLLCNASVVIHTGLVTVNNGGVYTAPNTAGSVSYTGGIVLNATSTYTKGTATVTFNGSQTITDNNATKQDLGICVTSGAVSITLASTGFKVTTFTPAINSTIVGGGYVLTCNGNCDLSLTTISGNLDITIVNTSATFKGNGVAGYIRNLILNGAGTTTQAANVNTTTTTITIGTLVQGTYSHTISSATSITDTWNTSTSANTSFQGNVNINGGGILDCKGGGHVILGTASSQSTLANSGTVRFSGNTVNTSYISGYDVSHYGIITGSSWDWDYGGAASLVRIGWIDIQYDMLSTGGAGVAIYCWYSITTDKFSMTTGDTIDGTPGEAITHSNTLWVNVTLNWIGSGVEYFPLTAGEKYYYLFYRIGRFALTEISNCICKGKYVTGSTVTIALYNAVSGAVIPITSASCSEIGVTGLFTWSASNITTPPVILTSYVYKMSDGSQEQWGSFEIGGYPDVISNKIGTPVALDGGLATLAGNFTKLADDNNGADFDAGTDSLHEISDVVDLIQTDTNNIRTVDVPALTGSINAVGALVTNVDGDLIADTVAILGAVAAVQVSANTIIAMITALGINVTAIGTNVVSILQLNQNKMIINRATSELWLYDDVGTTVIKKWALTDKDGHSIVLTGRQPANRGKWY